MSAPEKVTGEADPNATPMPIPLSVGSGLIMGGADAIPGVSGGTIALILGIYERFIGSLAVVVKAPLHVRDADGRAHIVRALKFLVPLGVGILIAYYLATKLLIGPTEEPGVMRRAATAPAAYAFFFGLVLASIPHPWKRIRSATAACFIAAGIGAAAAVVFVGLPYASATPPTWTLLLGGAGAIAVMLLPGVSGSLFLVIIGQYAAVAGAVHDRAFTTLAVFAAGMVLGVALFVPALRLLLRKHHDLTMAALTGLMAGSLRALWPWKTSYDPKVEPMLNTGVDTSTVAIAIGGFVVGVGVVFLLSMLEKRLARYESDGTTRAN